MQVPSHLGSSLTGDRFLTLAFFYYFLHFRHIIMIYLKTHYVFCIIFSFYSPYLYFYSAITTTILSYIINFLLLQRRNVSSLQKRKTTKNGFKTLLHPQRSIFIKSILKFSDHCLALYCIHSCVQLHIRIIVSVCNYENTCFLISVCFDLLRIK